MHCSFSKNVSFRTSSMRQQDDQEMEAVRRLRLYEHRTSLTGVNVIADAPKKNL